VDVDVARSAIPRDSGPHSGKPDYPPRIDGPLLLILLLGGAFVAGGLGSLTGLGGGVVLIPLMVLAFGIDLRYAVGASLVAVIATSSGAAGSQLRGGLVNVRVATLLELATAVGAILGALAAPYLPREIIALLFGFVALYSAYTSARASVHEQAPEPDSGPDPLGLGGQTPHAYVPRHMPVATGLMVGAGALSALVGVGGGVLKVVVMDRLMRLPFKVSTSTSNFMIGVTAAASAGGYFHRGMLEPRLCVPVALGALGGAMVGSRLLRTIPTRTVQIIFAGLVALAAIEIIRRALMHQI
jgi:uncharacterized membrane protein YfcA